MPSWPGTLPAAPLADGFRETIPDTAIRTDMEQGPAKVRRRTTAAVRRLTLSYILDKDEIVSLETFFVTTLMGGALSFTFTHPRTAVVETCRFTKPPGYAALNGNFFKVDIELEILP